MLATKISFMNEVANICETVGADVREVRAGIGSDRRIGYHFIYPGVGYGGSCFPKDVRALIDIARKHGCESNLVEAVDTVNNFQKRVMARKIIRYFEERGGAAGKTVAMWGLAFKANTDDIRESAALDIIGELTKTGIHVRAYDPVAGANAREKLQGNPAVTLMDSQYEPVEGANVLAVVTDWNQFRNPDFHRLKNMLSDAVIFDGRNLYSRSFMKEMGFTYISIGRQPVVAES